MHFHPPHRCLAAICLILLCGCESGPREYVVTGSVTYQGQPVAQGEIVFADAKGSGSTATGKIKNGRYELRTTAGEKSVRITATKETGRIIKGAMDAEYPELVDLIPPQYNTASTLLCRVDPNGDLVLDFVLP